MGDREIGVRARSTPGKTAGLKTGTRRVTTTESPRIGGGGWLGYPVETTPEAVEFLIRRGYHKTLGARPMRATVERFLQDAITESVLHKTADAVGWRSHRNRTG